jgi:hypothetical protein
VTTAKAAKECRPFWKRGNRNGSERRVYISEKEFGYQYEYAFNLMNMMVAFKKKIN